MRGNLTAGQVLDHHTRLTERMTRPDKYLLSFLRYHIQSAISSNGGTSSNMFHPIIDHRDRHPAVTREHAQQLAQQLGNQLVRAETFQVTAEMVQAFRGVFESTWAGPEVIDSMELPCEAGFAWLDDSWRIGLEDGFVIRALSWAYEDIMTGDDTALTPAERAVLRTWPCVRVGLWRWDSDVDDSSDLGGAELGPLVLTHTALVPLGLEFRKPDNSDVHATDSFLALVHLLWMFLGMEITATERPHIDRGFRRRAQRVLKHDEVRVILLRRIRHATDPDGTCRRVDWSCRWPVQGHYRHAERTSDGHHAVAAGFDKRCAACGGALHYVRPYIKGPDGLPLHATDKTVKRLVR